MLWMKLFLPFAGGYFLSYHYRTANAVIGPVLSEELSLGAADLGLLTSAYFIAFGCGAIAAWRAARPFRCAPGRSGAAACCGRGCRCFCRRTLDKHADPGPGNDRDWCFGLPDGGIQSLFAVVSAGKTSFADRLDHDGGNPSAHWSPRLRWMPHCTWRVGARSSGLSPA